MKTRLCITGKRVIAGVTATIYVAAATIMVLRGDGPWAEVQVALAICSAVTAVTL